MSKSLRIVTTLTATSLAAFALAACQSEPAAPEASVAAAADSHDHNHDHDHDDEAQAGIVESSSPRSRVALTYDGGIMILDGTSLEVVGTIEKDGFLRLSPAGNNRHLVVADGSSYTMLDLGVWGQKHGDHNHYYETAPTLTDLSFAADGTGHVIADHGRAAMFADGTGQFEVYQLDALVGEDNYTASEVATDMVTLPAAHHGLAIPLDNDQYLVSVGDENSRSGAAVVDADGKTVVESDECTGIHGEAMAANETFTLGCEDGILIYKDGEFTKVTNPEDPYSRSGNQAGDANSRYVLVDYKTDKDAELERPEQFAVIDTVNQTRTKIGLPEGVSYTFRSLARGPQGAHLLLTTDGKLRFWAEDGSELGSVDVVAPWEESLVWQDPRPAIWVDGDLAYVTEPATNQLHTVDLSKLASGEAKVVNSVELPHTPNEINGVARGSALVTSNEVHAH